MVNLCELPEDIICEIVSYLTAKEAISLSILSKQFLRAARTNRALVFDLGQRPLICDIAERCKKVLDYVVSTLVRYHKEDICLETFTLMANPNFQRQNRRADLHYQCIGLATSKSLKNLNLQHFWVLPLSILEGKTLVQLSLHCCSLRQPNRIMGPNLNLHNFSALPSSSVCKGFSLVQLNLCTSQHKERIMWPNLKRLSLRKISFDERTFAIMIKGCPLIEIFEIDECCQNTHPSESFSFKITNLHNLKQLKAGLSYWQRVEVKAAPNLEFVDCINFSGHSSYDQLRFLSSEYRSVRILKLFNAGFEGNFSKYSVHWTQRFPQLEELSIQGYTKLESINISSRSLKKLQLISIPRLQVAHFDVPNIALFSYENRINSSFDVMPKLSFTVGSGRWISRIDFECNHYMGSSCWVKLKEFLTSLKGSDTSIFLSFTSGVADIPMAFPIGRDVPDIREVFISARDPFHGNRYSLGIFLICCPRTITFCWTGYKDQKLLSKMCWTDYKYHKLLYEMLVVENVNNHHPGHSNLRLVELWNVTDIEIFKINKDREKIQYSNKERVLQMYQPLPDCGEFMEQLKAFYEKSQKSEDIAISFNLEWRKKLM